ncbi:mitogen-activated protein kinase [Xylaria bambusicola]|uniref:mitogen-activated protein kinase n=1 Tax=Xylaria bambusicola TaxID=326684 RepID=UPI00200889D2|nr:mitogen-activated protein kinase [Xylaria bambusicola]KAI0509099.1 mitogen-activated protein kinase [Xylaria bambusicola]
MAAEVYPSEEKTEPFTPEELQLRMGKSIQVDESGDAHHDHIPLDHLVIDEDHHKNGLRILVRPLTKSRSVSPGNDNCQWLTLRAEVGNSSQSKSKVLAVTQTSKDINFSIRIPQAEEGDRPPLWCELYYDPASDSLILWNKSEIPVVLARVSLSDHAGANYKQEILPGATRELSPGTWRISVGIPVLDFRILEKRPATLHVPSDSFESSPARSQILSSSLGKRSFSSDDFATENAVIEKRLRRDDTNEENEDNVIILFNTAKTKEIAIPNGHALLQVQKDETLAIPGDSDTDGYQLTKRDQIATTGASSVYTAEHSHVPDGVITVKVLKTRGPQTDNRPQDAMHRNVIRQADIWLREYQSQEDLQHESIVRLHGGDARYLSLYMEHVDGKDLAARNVWRDITTDKFVGGRADAIRILKDIAGALHYIHQKKRIHNDIKPANILYSKDRGAVLCDFGLSTRTVDPATNGGTPYYVPPEFIGQKLRGPASDVWALGVTMLYVLRKIPFPDARGIRGHPKQLYWMIADLNRRHGQSSSRTSSAVTQMQQWLSEVNESKAQLNSRDKIEFLVLQMLTPNPLQRITMAKVMHELHPDKETILAR